MEWEGILGIIGGIAVAALVLLSLPFLVGIFWPKDSLGLTYLRRELRARGVDTSILDAAAQKQIVRVAKFAAQAEARIDRRPFSTYFVQHLDSSVH